MLKARRRHEPARAPKWSVWVTQRGPRTAPLFVLGALLAGVLSGPPLARAEVSYRARGGENVWLIAAAHGIGVHKLIARSKLSLAQLLNLPAGMRITLPVDTLSEVPDPAQVRARQSATIARLPAQRQDATYLLGLGETLWDVALRFDLSINKLIEANHVKEEELWKLSFETPILLPGIAQASVEQPGARAPSGTFYRLTRGQTLWDVASKYQVGLSELMAANGMDIKDVQALTANARVFVPVPSGDGRFGAKLSTARQRAQELATQLQLGSPATAAALYRGEVKDAWQQMQPDGGAFSGTLIWPVASGHFVRGYGSGPQSYHLAIDIGAEIGAKVRAAAPGLVAYAGHAIRGYGNLVMLIHPGGLVTMYAHNSALYVIAGEQIDVGEAIAEVGSSGLSRGPHLHFELMYAGENCDPTLLLRPGVQREDGSVDKPAPPLNWRPPAARPNQITCARRRHLAQHEEDEAFDARSSR
jgi:murein DD-endopeptidase MepM/ murein hydrolase activator NlpD